MPKNKNKEKITPSKLVVGGSNTSGLTLIEPNSIPKEPFALTSGLPAVKIDGVNGNGDKGKENPITALDVSFMGEFKNTSTTKIIADYIPTVHRVDFRDHEKDEVHQLFFDHRRNGILAHFVLTKDGEKEIIKRESVDKFALLKPSISKKELEGAFATSIQAISLKEVVMNSGFWDEIKKQELSAPKTIGDISKFIKVFDKYFEATDENIKGLKRVIVDMDEKIDTPSISDFKDGISTKYSQLSQNGITVTNYNNAKTIFSIMSGASKDDVEKGVADNLVSEAHYFFQEQKHLSSGVRVESDVSIGVDETGVINLIENNNIPFKSGGEIYTTLIQPVMKDYDEAQGILKKKAAEIKKKLSGGEFDEKFSVDENKVIQAEQTLISGAIELAKDEKLGEEVEKFLISNGGFSSSIINAKKEGDVNASLAKMYKLHDFIKRAITKNVIETKDILDKGMMTIDGSRRRQLPYSTPKKHDPLNGTGLSYKDIQRVRLGVKIPNLSIPIGDDKKNEQDASSKNVNFSLLEVDVLDIFIDKKSLQIAHIDGLNNISAWREKMKLPRIISALGKLDRGDENFEKKFKDLLNYGSIVRSKNKSSGSIEEKQSGYGLLAVKKNTNNPINAVYGKLIQELRDTAYDNGEFKPENIVDVQNIIKELGKRGRNEDMLARSVVAVDMYSANYGDLLEKAFYVAKGNKMSKALVSGDYKGLSAFEKKSVRDIKALLDVRVSSIITMLKKEENANIMDIARQFSSNVRFAKANYLTGKNGETKEIFFSSPKWIPEVINHETYKKGLDAAKVTALIQNVDGINIDEVLQDNRERYKEEKGSGSVVSLGVDSSEEISLEGYSLNMGGVPSASSEENVVDMWYYKHPESGSAWVQEKQVSQEEHDGLVEEITEEDFMALKASGKWEITESIKSSEGEHDEETISEKEPNSEVVVSDDTSVDEEILHEEEQQALMGDIPMEEIDNINLNIEEHDKTSISEAAKDEDKVKEVEAPSLFNK